MVGGDKVINTQYRTMFSKLFYDKDKKETMSQQIDGKLGKLLGGLSCGKNELMESMEQLQNALEKERVINRENIFKVNAEMSDAFKRAYTAGEDVFKAHNERKQKEVEAKKPSILKNTGKEKIERLKAVNQYNPEKMTKADKKLLKKIEKAEKYVEDVRKKIDKKYAKVDVELAELGGQLQLMATNRGFIPSVVQNMYDKTEKEKYEYKGTFDKAMTDQKMTTFDPKVNKGIDGGAMNEVYKVALTETELRFVKPGEFKTSKSNVSSVMQLGELEIVNVVDTDDKIYGVTNEKAFRDQGQQVVGKLFGTDVIVGSSLQIDLKTGYVSVMNVADGNSADKFYPVNSKEHAEQINEQLRNIEKKSKEHDYKLPRNQELPLEVIDISNPSVQVGALELGTLDYICGQYDRHSGNFFISKDENNNYKFHGIDNDGSFGLRETKAPEVILPFITPNLKEKILNLKPDEVVDALKGLVDRGEKGDEILKGVRNRVEMLQQYVKDEKTVVVDESTLGEKTSEQLQKVKNSPLYEMNRNLMGYKIDDVEKGLNMFVKEKVEKIEKEALNNNLKKDAVVIQKTF
jgi:hypothetical protein